MTDIETRLRDAVEARTGSVTYDPGAYDAIVRRRDRRRFTRAVRPVGAVAGTVVAVALTVLVARLGVPTATVAAGAPQRLVAIRGDRAVVLDTTDLGGEPVAESTAAQGEVVSVTAVGDGETFYAAARGPGCRSTLLRLDASGRVSEVATVDLALDSVAVTRDGRRLAYGGHARGERGCDGQGQVHVRDLASGAEDVWRTDRFYSRLDSLVWSPDGRRFAWDAVFQVFEVDTTLPGRTVSTDHGSMADLGNHPEKGWLCFPTAPGYLGTGELAVAVSCERAGWPEPRTNRVHVYDARTQTLGREVFRLPDETGPRWLALDATGEHALAGVTLFDNRDQGHGEGTVYVWNGDGDALRLRDGGHVVSGVAW